jgi:hypothetical protein
MRTDFKLNRPISEYQIKNLIALRDILISIKNTHTIDMHQYSAKGSYDCDTSCCMVGHAYHRGIGSKPIKRPPMSLNHDFDFFGFLDRELCDTGINLSFKEGGSRIYFISSLHSFLFSLAMPDSFDQAIERLHIVINSQWGRIKLLDDCGDYAQFDANYHYFISTTKVYT